MTVAALYVEQGGVYYGLDGVEPWGLPDRDARLYPGPHPVVAHPPCNRWAMPTAKMNQTRYGHVIGDDGGCFARAIMAVEEFGGVLEHPAHSWAWRAFGLERPVKGAWLESRRGYVAHVAQSAYGHRARKATWLYHVGPRPADLDWSEPSGDACVTWGDYRAGQKNKPRLSRREAKATPIPFRDLLLSMARSAAHQGAA